MVQPKPKRAWQPSEVERRVGLAARLTAEREAARVPWPQLQEARENFVAWEAFTFWVRAIEDTEGDVPQSLARAIEKRCPGFSEFAADDKRHHPDSPPCFWSYLEEWIHERIFGKAWRDGWMNAVGYYAARDLASLRNHAYWDDCERQWNRTKPAGYPSFGEWLKASENCPDRVLDDYGMRNPEKALLMRECLEYILRVSRALPKRQAEVWILADVFEWTTEEVSTALAISPEYQRVLLHRAHQRLRLELKRYLGDLGSSSSSQ